MDHPAAALAAASSASLAAAVAAGWPPDWTLGAAMFGGLYSAWAGRPAAVTVAGVVGVLLQVALGAVVGLMAAASWPVIAAVLASLLPALAPVAQLHPAVPAGLGSLLSPALLAMGRAWLARYTPAAAIAPRDVGDKG